VDLTTTLITRRVRHRCQR